ncbi:MAG: hypothetical protein FWG94_11895 [Oscillospiraceae bacterium]|nr:hypothetical protein [Oscillospiraceae bacterium]
MNQKDYLYAAALCLGKPYPFIVLASRIKRRYVILHFMLIFCLLFIPVFTLAVRTQPDQLYTRAFSQGFENAAIIYYNTERFSPEKTTYGRPAVYVFDDFVVYTDPNITLSAPAEFFVSGELSRPFGEVFSMIAVYNMYIPRFLLPILMIAFFILLVLQLFFYLMSAFFLGISRMASTRFDFGERVRIVIMSSLFPALISMAVGFILPAVHIVLFQMVNLLMLFYLSKRYDKKERELFLTA